MSSRKEQRAVDAQVLEARDASRSLDEWESEKKKVLLLKCNTYNLDPRGTIKILAERLFHHFNDVGASSLMDEELQTMEGLAADDDDQGSLEDFNVEGANGYVEPLQDVSAAAEEQLDPSFNLYQDNALSEPYAWGEPISYLMIPTPTLKIQPKVTQNRQRRMPSVLVRTIPASTICHSRSPRDPTLRKNPVNGKGVTIILSPKLDQRLLYQGLRTLTLSRGFCLGQTFLIVTFRAMELTTIPIVNKPGDSL